MKTPTEQANFIMSSLAVTNLDGDGQISSALETLIRQGIMDDDSVRAIVAVNWKKKLLSVHPHKVGQMKGNDSRWFSYVSLPPPKKRKKIVATSEAGLYEKLYAWYFENEYAKVKDQLARSRKKKKKPRAVTLRNYFDEWLQYRLATVNRPGTVRRNENDYRRFFLNEPLSQKVLDTPLDKLKKPDWEEWAYNLIRKYDMTQTDYNNAALIVRQIYQFLIDKELLDKNPYTSIRIRKNTFRKVRKKPASTQVFTDREKAAVITEACRLAEEQKDENFYVIPLCFLTGLRVGEVLALTFTDFDFVNHTLDVHSSLCREEVRNDDGTWSTPVYVIHDRLKGNADERIIMIDRRVEGVVKDIRKMQMRKGKISQQLFTVLTPNTINMKLYRICDHLKIPRRSIHKTRKTYASDLLNANVDPDFVRTQMGHRELQTTLNSYVYSTTASEDLLKQLEDAL